MRNLQCSTMLRVNHPRTTRGQYLFAVLLGVASGYYIWNEPLKQYFAEQKELEAANEPPKTNLLFTPAVVIGIGVFLGTAVIGLIRHYDIGTYGDRELQRASDEADFLYQRYKAKDLESQQNAE